MSRKNENTGFVCAHCGKEVKPVTNGSFRDHCPFCLYSLHVDEKVGDRLNSCRGALEPVGVLYNPAKGYQIKYRCRKCGQELFNKIAEQTDQPDDIDLICRLMSRQD